MDATTDNEQNLLKKISELELELKKIKQQKKYGLVWEDKPEQIVEDCKRNVPILRLKEKKKGIDPIIITDEFKDENILIEGDNYHALSVLNYTHKGEIDVIYIDPPYNTGNKDFIYNDSFVDREDAFRHSKWLSFMDKRLRLAKELLVDTGIIFISIDDNEQSQLKLLCDQIFGEENFIETIMVEISNTGGMKVGAAKDGKIAKNGEFILLYSKSVAHKDIERTALFDYVAGFDAHFNLYITADNKIEKFSDILARNVDVVNEFKHFGVEVKNDSISLNKLAEFFDKSDVLQKFVMGNIGNIVRPREEIPNIPNSLNLKKGKWIEYKSDKRNDPYYLTLDKDGDIIQLVPLSFNYRKTDDFISKFGRSVIRGDFWKNFWIDMGNISKEGDVKFENGKKPVRLIKQLLKWSVSSNQSAKILDFFAGSGTTGQAVLELNKQDGGDRKFILCTNNENNIAEEITYKRLKQLIKDKNSIGENLYYYKTDLVDIEKLHHTPDHAKVKLTYQVGEMIGLRENTLNEIEKNEWWQIFEGQGKISAIYFKEDKERLQELVVLLEKKNKPTALYVFSWGKNEYKSEYSSVNIRVEDIPEPILEVYKEINRL